MEIKFFTVSELFQRVFIDFECRFLFISGWPGTAKKFDITTRDCVAMEIDECLVPSVDPEAGSQEEEMDIDTALVEVRQLMRTQSHVNHVEYIPETEHEKPTSLSIVSLNCQFFYRQMIYYTYSPS